MIYTMMGLMDSISQLTPLVIKGQGGSFRVSEDAPLRRLVRGYQDRLLQEEAENTKLRVQSAPAAASQENEGLLARSPEQRAREIQEWESRVEQSDNEVRALKDRRRFFANLARFQDLNTNDKKLVSELSIYWHMLPRTKELFQTYTADRRSLDFEEFTGPNGQWVNFLSSDRIRGQISVNKRIQNNFIRFVYSGESSPGSSPSASMMHGLLNRIEQKQPPIPYRCRPY